jgi:hypothetical protein
VSGFVAGAGLSRIGSSERAVRAEKERSDGDPLLQWALSLQAGEPSVLLESADVFVVVHARSRDPRLDRGLIRLAELTRSDASLTEHRRRVLAELLLDHVDAISSDSSAVFARDPVFESLRAIR